IGMLEVFEGHKRKGFGAELLSFMTNLFLEQGLVPFGQIVVDNVASLALNRKLGYTLTDSRLYWVF
ncbi:MAG: GNAT family N-acetyltransferase, partial [Coriobacteriia bacterium]|nr:GNAT family N-acetyltransferase [Coriobacteriia bacterium]